MNKHLQRIEAPLAVSITALKRKPSRVLEAVEEAPVAILDRNRVKAYLILAEAYEDMLDRIEDAELSAIAAERRNDPVVEVSIDELLGTGSS